MDESISETCENIMTIYPVYQLANHHAAVGAFLFSIAVIYFLNSGIILYWIKKQENEAKLGDHKTVKSTIFPVFVDVMWFNAAVNVYTSIIMLTVDQPIEGGLKFSALMWATFFGLSHMVNEGVAYMLIQKGLGRYTQRKVLRRSIVWGFICFVIRYFTYLRDKEGGMVFILLVWKSAMVLFYGAIALVPNKHLYRRPAATFFARIWACWQLLNLVSSVLIVIKMASPVGLCVELFGAFLIYAIVQPIAIYITLLKDSEWWQGQFEDESEDDMSGSVNEDGRKRSLDIVSPLAGLNINLHSAQSLADCIDRMITEEGVKLLNFAYVQLDETQLLGQGSFSKVYRGTYRSQKCAIKLVFTFDLTVDIIRRVAAEAQILSSLEHPNIIHSFGVAVTPPSVCLLLEICDYGSLSDVLRGKLDEEEQVIQSALPLSFADMLHLALGCARGLAAMHRLGQQVCHRDVKSLNFLVDCQLTAKLADLELGTDTSVSKPIFPVAHAVISCISSLCSPSSAAVAAKQSKQPSLSRLSAFRASLASGPASESASGSTHNPKAIAVLPHWMAPEVLSSLSCYTQSSDVYSFGVVLWEMLCNKLPYEGIEDLGRIRDTIVAGERLEIESAFGDGVAEHLRELIKTMWVQHAESRPTMDVVVSRLEDILQLAWSDHIAGAHPPVDISPLFPAQKSSYSLGLSKGPVFATAETRQKVVDEVQANFKWAEFDKYLSRRGLYAVVSSAAPHFLLRASYSWYSEFGYSPADLGQLEVLNAIVTSNHGPKSCRQDLQKVDLKQSFSYDLQGQVQNCVVLELHNRKTGVVGLYSVHCFPVSCDAHKDAAIIAGYDDRVVNGSNRNRNNSLPVGVRHHSSEAGSKSLSYGPDGSARDVRMKALSNFLPGGASTADAAEQSALMVVVFNLLNPREREESSFARSNGSSLSSINSLDIDMAAP